MTEKKSPEYRKHPIMPPEKTKKTVTFVHRDFPDDVEQEIQVIASTTQANLDRLEGLGYIRKAGAKVQDPDTEEPKKAAPRKAASSS